MLWIFPISVERWERWGSSGSFIGTDFAGPNGALDSLDQITAHQRVYVLYPVTHVDVIHLFLLPHYGLEPAKCLFLIM